MPATPLSYRQYAGNGSTVTFAVPFPYLLKSHVKVFLGYNIIDGTYTTQLADGVGYVWSSGTQIQTTAAPATGQTLTVIRQTPNTTQLVQWQDGSNLIASDIDTADKQNLYVVQEQQDRNDVGISQSTTAYNTSNTASATANAAAALVATAYIKDGSTPMTGDVATGGYKIRSVGTPVLATDAATKGYVDTFVNQTANIADAAVATAKIADGAITSAKIADGAVVATDLAANSVITAKVLDGNITEAKLATDSVSTAKIVNSAVTTAKIADANVTESKLATDSVTVNKIKNGEITSAKLNPSAVVTAALQAGATPADTSFFTTQASDARYFRQDSTETISSGMAWSSSDGFIATTAAIDARVIDLVDDVGGFVPIANETSFPATNPDINNPDNGGTIVSIKEIVTTRVPSSGVVTITGGAGANTVTITGCGSTTLLAGYGVLVETTATLHTYSFHRLVPKATEVTTVAGIATDVTTVATNATSVATVSGSIASVNTVSGSIANVNAAASNSTNINTVSASIANVNTVGSGIANVNTVAANNANITTVAGLDANISTVATNIANVNTAASNITNVNNVGGSIANVNTCAANLSAILAAPTQAANAAASASASANSASAASSLVTTITNLSYLLNWGLLTEAAGASTDYGAL